MPISDGRMGLIPINGSVGGVDDISQDTRH